MKVFFSEHFKNQLKKLKRKYPHIKNDLLRKINVFNPRREISIGRSIYKIRIPSIDMRRGASGGFRSYIYFYKNKDLLLPLCIYAKSDMESITDNELKYHFDRTIQEIVAQM